MWRMRPHQSLTKPVETEQPRLVPPARASEMSAPARPPKSKSSSYNNLISEPSASATPTLALGSTERVVAAVRTSTPAPLQGPVNTDTKESPKSDTLSPTKLREKTSQAPEFSTEKIRVSYSLYSQKTQLSIHLIEIGYAIYVNIKDVGFITVHRGRWTDAA